MSQSLVDLICKRVSFPRLGLPAPESKILERIYRSALRAPDHMRLRPWRYLLVEGDARLALGDLFCDAAERDDPNLTDSQREKFRAMPMRAPVIVIAVSANIEHPKVPVEEQVISCGVGVGYMLLALQAEGFGGVWRTGSLAENSWVKAGLGIAGHETLVGFLYLGTPEGVAKAVPVLDVDDFFKPWCP